MVKNTPLTRSAGAELPTAAGNPLAARKKKAPDCFLCRTVRAKHLGGIGEWRRFAVFCSHACATKYAMFSVVESKFTWCVEHRAWTDRFGHCLQCDQEKAYIRENPPRILLGDVAEYAEGVKHE